MEVGRTGALGLVGVVVVPCDDVVVEVCVVAVEDEGSVLEEEVDEVMVVVWVSEVVEAAWLVEVLVGSGCGTVRVVTVVVGDPPTVTTTVLVCIVVVVAVELCTPGMKPLASLLCLRFACLGPDNLGSYLQPTLAHT